jgi:hypothetical protein
LNGLNQVATHGAQDNPGVIRSDQAIRLVRIGCIDRNARAISGFTNDRMAGENPSAYKRSSTSEMAFTLANPDGAGSKRRSSAFSS